MNNLLNRRNSNPPQSPFFKGGFGDIGDLLGLELSRLEFNHTFKSRLSRALPRLLKAPSLYPRSRGEFYWPYLDPTSANMAGNQGL